MAETFLNSDESPAGAVMTDNFSDGVWYQTEADETAAANHGWRGEPFPGVAGYAAPANAIANAFRTNKYAATTGSRSVGQGWTAWHRFGPTTATLYSELYFRGYLKFLSGYDFAHEKIWEVDDDFNRTSQHGWPLATHFGNNKFGIRWNIPGDPIFDHEQDQGNDITITAGRFYYVETHINLGTFGSSNGTMEMWADDAGVDGDIDVGAGTLRLQRNNVQMQQFAGNPGMGAWLVEHWLPSDPPQYTGSGTVYSAHFVVATQRIGPLAVGGSAIALDSGGKRGARMIGLVPQGYR